MDYKEVFEKFKNENVYFINYNKHVFTYTNGLLELEITTGCDTYRAELGYVETVSSLYNEAGISTITYNDIEYENPEE